MSELDHVLSLLNPDETILAAGRRRQAAVWRDEEPDVLPILVGGPGHPDKKRYPDYNLKECYYDREKMLISHAWGMIAALNGRSDSLPSMRCNTGVGTLATAFGCVSTPFEDKMPWVTRHATKDEIRAFEPTDLARKGEMPRVLDYMSYFAEKLDGRGRVYAADNQGPMDLAHLVYGDAIFTDLYDDPAFVHGLLDKATTVIIEGVKLMKAVVGEPVESGYHGNNLYMERGGVRVCEDTTTLLSAPMVEEFALPYTARVLEAFGGGWVHFCGGQMRLLEQVVRMPGLRGVNFGNPERYDPAVVLPVLQSRGQFYHGGFPRNPDESLEAYFRRILGCLNGERRGLILTCGVRDGDPPAPQAVELWRELQTK